MNLQGQTWTDPALIITFEDGDPSENPWINGKPKREEIEIEDYCSLWPQQYQICKTQIAGALAKAILNIEHVGSTAVPGLPAKPVIDIDLIVSDPEREDEYVPALEALGYILTIRERSWYRHRMLRHENPRVNLHVFGPPALNIFGIFSFEIGCGSIQRTGSDMPRRSCGQKADHSTRPFTMQESRIPCAQFMTKFF